MHSRTLRSRLLPVLVLCAASLGAAPALAASDDDAAALETARSAMDDDFLEMRFKQAQQKLQSAITTCGKGCSAGVMARLHRDMGVVYFSGLADPRNAQASFERAVKADPNVLLDSRWSTPDLLDAFEKAGGLRIAAIVHEPVAEQKVKTPVPIYAELPEGLDASEVVLHFRKSGKKKWKDVRMKKKAGAYRAKIPCEAVKVKGTIEYYIEALQDGSTVAQSGTVEEPLNVEIVKKVHGEKPSFPDEDPLEPCPKNEVAEGDDGEGPEALATPPEPVKKPKKIWLRLAFHKEIAFIGGDDVCSPVSQDNGDFYCFRSDGAQYVGAPVMGQYDNVKAGFVLATTRVLLGLDYLLAKKVSVGAAAGYAFQGGGPTPALGSDFFPAHVEIRGSYYVAGEPATPKQPVVAAFLATGMAQVDAMKQVTVFEDRSLVTDQVNPNSQPVEAWKRLGRGFIAPGASLLVPLGPGAVSGDLRFMVMFPATSLVVSPGIGYALGF